MAVGNEITTPTDENEFRSDLKPNFHPCFFAQGKWWVVGFRAAQGGWWRLYRRDAQNDFVYLTTPGQLETRADSRPTCIVMSDGTVVIAFVNSGNNRIFHLTYNATNDDWDVNSGFPVTGGAGIDHTTNNYCLFRDSNDRLIAIKAEDDAGQKIKANYSDDFGVTWATWTNIRTGSDGLVNATTHVSGTHFDWGASGGQRAGFCYVQASGSGEHGFMEIAATGTPTTKGDWTQTDFTLATGTPEENIACTAYHAGGGHAGKVFCVIADTGGDHWLLERSAGTSGTWTEEKITEFTTRRPGIVINTEDEEIIVYAADASAGTESQYLTAPIGNLSSHSSVMDLITDDVSTDFNEAHSTYDNVNVASGFWSDLAQNGATSRWERLITITANTLTPIDPSAAGTGSTGIIVPAAAGTGSTGIIVPTAD